MALHPVWHACLVWRHKWWVGKFCFSIGLYRQGLLHDCSKFSFSEFLPGMRYYQGSRSPADAEREERGVAYSWLHHKGRNRHHLEYWFDYDPETQSYGALPMPLSDLAESICDRIAASRIYRGSDYTPDYPLEYYLRGRKHCPVHPETDALFQYYLKLLADEGENACLQKLRAHLKQARAARRRGEQRPWLRPLLKDVPGR